MSCPKSGTMSVQRRPSRIVTSWAWCHIPMISALGSQSSLCSRFQASQGYKASSSPERKEEKEKEGRREMEGREKGLLKEIMNNQETTRISKISVSE